jgi:hypothetical protein
MSTDISIVDVIDEARKSAPLTYAELQKENEELKRECVAARSIIDTLQWKLDCALALLKQNDGAEIRFVGENGKEEGENGL